VPVSACHWIIYMHVYQLVEGAEQLSVVMARNAARSNIVQMCC
jgi:hypothetical protein